MALYACFLAGSNYLAPVICGFISEYHGWQWVFYWPSIFTAVAVVFLFFSMEETSYICERQSDMSATVKPDSLTNHPEKMDQERLVPTSDVPVFEGSYEMKTYWQKLSLLGPRQNRNNMLRRSYQTLYYLSWPVVFYAG